MQLPHFVTLTMLLYHAPRLVPLTMKLAYFVKAPGQKIIVMEVSHRGSTLGPGVFLRLGFNVHKRGT